MTLVRWNPFGDLLSLHGRWSPATTETEDRHGSWAPAVDIFERDDNLIIRAELPGVEPQDIDINVENNTLVLRGERKRDQQVYLRLERPFGRFSAQVALPESVDQARVHATHRNGVLEVVLPKRKTQERSRIEVTGT